MKTLRFWLILLLVLSALAFVVAGVLRIDLYFARKAARTQAQQRCAEAVEAPLLRRVFCSPIAYPDAKPDWYPHSRWEVDENGKIQRVPKAVLDKHLAVCWGLQTEYYAMGVSNRNGLELSIPDKSDRSIHLRDENKDGVWDYLEMFDSGARSIDYGANGTYDATRSPDFDWTVRVGSHWYKDFGKGVVAVGTQRVPVIFTNYEYHFANDNVLDASRSATNKTNAEPRAIDVTSSQMTFDERAARRTGTLTRGKRRQANHPDENGVSTP